MEPWGVDGLSKNQNQSSVFSPLTAHFVINTAHSCSYSSHALLRLERVSILLPKQDYTVCSQASSMRCCGQNANGSMLTMTMLTYCCKVGCLQFIPCLTCCLECYWFCRHLVTNEVLQKCYFWPDNDIKWKGIS